MDVPWKGLPTPLLAAAAVGVGGALGSLARYGLALLSDRCAPLWPLGTLSANLLGCFMLGIVSQSHTQGSRLAIETRLFLATGFCGGFTTLSTMVYDTTSLARGHGALPGVLYLTVTLLGAFATFGAGALLARSLSR